MTMEEGEIRERREVQAPQNMKPQERQWWRREPPERRRERKSPLGAVEGGENCR